MSRSVDLCSSSFGGRRPEAKAEQEKYARIYTQALVRCKMRSGEESHRGTESCRVEEQGADRQESLEEQQHRMFNSTRPLKKPGRLQQKKPQVRQAAKAVAEREAKARQQTRRKALAKTLQRQRTGTEEQFSERRLQTTCRMNCL